MSREQQDELLNAAISVLCFIPIGLHILGDASDTRVKPFLAALDHLLSVVKKIEGID